MTQSGTMEPDELLRAAIEAALSSAIEDGMSTDLASVTFDFSDGGVTIRAKDSSGADYEGMLDADQLAAALDADVAEDAAETTTEADTADAPAKGEGAAA